MRTMAKWLSAVLAALLLVGAGLPGAGMSRAAAAGRVWYVAANAVGAEDGTSWADAFTTLQDALEAATAGDEIWIKGGTYYPTKDIHGNENPDDPRMRTFQMKNGVTIFGGFDAGMANPGMADRGDVTILSGNLGDPLDDTDNAYHVFFHPDGTVLDGSAVLDGVTVSGGYADAVFPSVHPFLGGGFFNEGVTLTLRNVVISGNKSSRGGGGMYNKNATVFIENSTIIDNASFNGGGIYLTDSALTLVHTTVRQNRALQGAGIWATDSPVTVVGGDISGNEADSLGGGIRFEGYEDQYALTLAHVSVSGNKAEVGGGVYIQQGTATLLDVDLTNNEAPDGGGWSSLNTDVTWHGGVISGNKADLRGGGISVAGGKMEMNNTLIATNASDDAGGLLLWFTPAVLTNVTVAGNKAINEGGGIISRASSLHARNTIIWGNSSSVALEDGGTAYYEYSLIEGSRPDGVWDEAIGTDGGNNVDADPLFTTPLAHGDAPAVGGNYSLNAEAPESPARDSGNSAYVADLPADVAGQARIFGAAVDIGAYETASGPALLTPTDTLASQQVAYGTALSDLPLPTEVTGSLSSGANVPILVAWDHGRPAYNGTLPGTYTFSGHLLLPGRFIVLSGPLTRTITVQHPGLPVSPTPPPPPPPSVEPPLTGAPSFSDTAGHWAAADISAAAAAGVVNGFPDGTFRPNEHITRLQFAVILARALGLSGTGTSIPFSDRADIPDWATADMALAVQHGIAHGYEDGTFRPHATITRAEAAAMVARAVGLPTIDADPPFADAAAIAAWARPYVAAVHAAGIMHGQGVNRFAPDDPATRAEAAVLLLRVWRSRGS